ncbi:hypothetical protein D8B26_002419 [Coccidioides posadasii str. Silveira]|nr:hypothetical protein CPAG_02191 [Coccidioides posadasii RMSCC 3488]QVM07728.1 hypothetical protein D8B26_002419 [Coccidioides posadasii str. Silveira]
MTLESKEPLPRPAPWRPLFQANCPKGMPAEFSLSTVHLDPLTRKAYPRVRTCMFRNFWADMFLHSCAMDAMKKCHKTTSSKAITQPNDSFATGAAIDYENDGIEGHDKDPCNFGRNLDKVVNDAVFESDMFTFTTDVRMTKVGDLMDGNGGSGGYVEGVFWFKQSSTQWRVKGQAFIIGGSQEDETEKMAREEIKRGMRLREGYSDERASSWSWEKEITAQFANLSPLMRGTFKNPPPGTPKANNVQNPDLKQGQRVYDLYDPVARSNFRVVVIRPEEVEMVDLSNPEAAKRTRWLLLSRGSGQGMEWKMEELWP